MPLRITHLETYLAGGAGRAVARLHSGLQKLGAESTIFTLDGRNPDGSSTLHYCANRKPWVSRACDLRRMWSANRQYRTYQKTLSERLEYFSDDRTARTDLLAQLPPSDLLNLHWVAHLVDYTSFFPAASSRLPIVWTLHDMSGFTGGCHYDDGCGKFRTMCGACPLLGSKHAHDLSRHVWKRKQHAFRRVPRNRLHLVSPSTWLAKEILASSLLREFPLTTIPNGVDTDTFVPLPQKPARLTLKIPEGAPVVLFVASSVSTVRKGVEFLVRAVQQLHLKRPFLLSVGSSAPNMPEGIPHLHLGPTSDDSLLLQAYSAADVFVITSLQDNLPNTVLESMACGTPVVGFNVGGIPDMVRDGETGFLVPATDSAALASKLQTVLDDPVLRQRMSEAARHRVETEFSLELQAKRYLGLYESMLRGTRHSSDAER